MSSGMRRTLLPLAIFLTTLTFSPMAVTGHLGTPVTAYLLTQPVTLDGKWTSTSEWSDAPETRMYPAEGDGVGYFRVKHDSTYLYVLAESLVDTSIEYNSAADWGDTMTVFLDTLHNGETKPATDDYRFRFFYQADGLTVLKTHKGDGSGWVRIVSPEGVEAMVALDTGNSPHAPHPHVTGELRIPMSILPVATFGFFIRFDDTSLFISENPPPEALRMHLYWPGPTEAEQGKDTSNWGDVSLSDKPQA